MKKLFWQITTILGLIILFISPISTTFKTFATKYNISIPSIVTTIDANEIYPMFTCPCCGKPLDPKNICCGSMKEMIDFIDSKITAKLSKKEVIMETVNRFGITSIIESERNKLDLLPTEKLIFNEAVGKQAPDFNLESIDGKTIKLSDYRGKNVVLFFNEGTMCYPACWDQIAELGNDERFNNDDVIAFSITVDQKNDWEKIVKETANLSNAKILFDSTRIVSLTYDVLSLKSSMHTGSFPGHTYFIIDKEGVIRYAFDDPNMAIWNNGLFDELKKLK